MSNRFYVRAMAVVLAASLVASCKDNKSGADSGGAPAKVASSDSSAPQAFSAEQNEAIKALVRKTLLENPEILVEASAVLQQKEQEEQEKAQAAALSAHADLLFRSKTSPVAGNEKGDVTVVEFFDYNCPHCRDGYLGIKGLMSTDPNARIVFKEFPIFGGASVIAAKAALAANMQGRYFDYHSALFATPGRVTETSAMQKAEEIGLDMEKLKKDMQSPEVMAALRENQKLANALGVQGTPAFFVGDKFISGAPDDLAQRMAVIAKDIRKNGCKNC